MDALLLDCLQTIHTQIWDHDKYKTKWEFEVAADDYYVEANEVQTITIDATGGTWNVDWAGTPTSVAFNVTAAALQAQLEVDVGAGNVTVTGGVGATGGLNPYIVEFVGTSAKTDVALITVDGSSLTGGAGTAVAVETTAGASIAITNDVFNPMFAVLNKIQRRRDHKELYQAESYPKIPRASLDTPLDSEAEPTRLEWFTWGDEFVISPPSTGVETYDAFGYRILNRSIWTYVSPTTTWQEVDLPDAYIETYGKCVLGFLLTATSDHAGADQWLRAAADELQSLAGLNSGNLMNRPTMEENEPLRMGGTPTSKVDYAIKPTFFIPIP